MKTSRLIIYTIVALAALVIAYLYLAADPPPGWPINLIHLLTRH